MKNYPLWKSITVFLVISIGVVFSIPSIVYQEDSNNWFLKNKINLGLDLQGGSYLLLEVQSDVLLKEELEFISDSVIQIARKKKINVIDINFDVDQIEFKFQNLSLIEEIRNDLFKQYRDINIFINQDILKL